MSKPVRRRLYACSAVTIMVIGVTCALVGSCAYFGVLGAPDVFTGCASSEVKELENAGQFLLPPSAQNLKSGCFGMQGWDGHAEFEMLPSDADTFVASTKLKSPLSPSEIPKNSDLMKLAIRAKSY